MSHTSLMGEMTPLETLKTQQTALRHAMLAEAHLMVESEPILTIAYTGALILSRMTWTANAMVPAGTVLPYRTLAHKILEEALDEMELLMNQCEGRA